MKQPARQLLALCAAAGMGMGAHGQSTVTVFGVLDSGVQRLSASGASSLTSVISDGNSSSRFGFRGTEDLGGGLKAGFGLEGGFSVDTGISGASSSNNKDSVANALFGRRTTVSLMGDWGEVRAGRDFVPSFHNLGATMHPFGTNGVGSSAALFYPVNAGGTTVRTHIRASNSVNYFLPASLGGFSGQLTYALGEQPAGATKDDGTYVGLRVAYADGPLAVAAATGKTDYATGDYTQSNIAANYKVGPAKIMLLWGQNKVGATKTSAVMLGTQWDVGPGQVRAAYTRLNAKNVASDATQLALGYVYDLSKRTALYANWSKIDNKGAGKTFNVGLAPVSAGGNSSGYEIGLRHNF